MHRYRFLVYSGGALTAAPSTRGREKPRPRPYHVLLVACAQEHGRVRTNWKRPLPTLASLFPVYIYLLEVNSRLALVQVLVTTGDNMILPVFTVLLACLLIVPAHADFHLNMFYRETKKYLSNIDLVTTSTGTHYIEATKDNPDMFCRFNFVTTNLAEGKVSFQTNDGNYFNRSAGNYIVPNEKSIVSSSEFEFIFESDPHRQRGARIALKANNGLYWTVEADRFIKAEGTKPVYFDIYPV